MYPPMEFTMDNIVQALKYADRMGAEKDEPEGARYVQLSETLVNLIVAKLEDCSLELKRLKAKFPASFPG